MTRVKWTRIAAACGVAGGFVWLGKLAVLAGTGREGGADVPLFGLGLALLLVASTGVATSLGHGWSVAARAAAITVAPVLALLAFFAVQIVSAPLDRVGPPSLDGEYGVVLAALLGVVVGSAASVRARHRTRKGSVSSGVGVAGP